jgi:hypothetical protein
MNIYATITTSFTCMHMFLTVHKGQDTRVVDFFLRSVFGKDIVKCKRVITPYYDLFAVGL